MDSPPPQPPLDPGVSPLPASLPGAVAPPLPGDPPATIGAPVTPSVDPARFHPSYVFLAVVSILSLAADISSKLWAEKKLDGYPGILNVWPNHIAFVLAKNRGGAWGLLQGTSENVRRPFFLLVSVAAIAFIVTLYRRLQPRQRALKWGLPLVLGGALGNVFDRIRYGHVIDFIDIHVLVKGHEHHWPTFNVADIAICVGVGLMAIDMFTAKKPALHGQDPGASLPPGPAGSVDVPPPPAEAPSLAQESPAAAPPVIDSKS